ncbi:hypothetical protein HK098_004145 [Nowakowskiella sp. JEL0407]|nr:hypothetical protein HK098_004145 [Nowakowskiella sp. JEL0407]
MATLISASDVVYDRDNPLALGGIASVYKGRWANIDVAVKIIRGLNDFHLKILHEVRILSRLRHKNAILLYGVATDTSTPLIILEYADGGSLYTFLQNQTDQINSPAVMNHLIRQISIGMEYIHSHTPPILHGDLKSANCLLTNLKFGVLNCTLKITDFGLSRIKTEILSSTMTPSGTSGTLRWIAPERFSGGKLTEKVDVFAFAMTVYEILSVGKVPYELNDIEDPNDFAIMNAICSNVRPVKPPTITGIPQMYFAGWWEVVESCWSHDPDKRPSFVEINQLLEKFDPNKLYGQEGKVASEQSAKIESNEETIYQASNASKDHSNSKVISNNNLASEIDVSLVHLDSKVISNDNLYKSRSDIPGLTSVEPSVAGPPTPPKPNHIPLWKTKKFILLILVIIIVIIASTITGANNSTSTSKTTPSPPAPSTTTNTTHGALLQTLKNKSPRLRSIAVLPQNRLFVSDEDGLYEWDISSSKIVKNFTGHRSTVYSIAATPGPPARLFSCSFDKTLIEWDLETAKPVRTFIGHLDWCLSVAVLPTGTTVRLFSGSADKSVIEWDLGTGSVVRNFTGHLDYVYSLAVVQDGSKPRLFSGSWDMTVREWDVSGGSNQSIRVMKGHTDYVNAISILQESNKTRLFSGSRDGTVLEWDLETGRSVRKFVGHSNWVISLLVVKGTALGNGSSRLYTGSADTTVKEWDVDSGTVVKDFLGHSMWVYALGVLENPMRLVSCAEDQNINIWAL